jgi:hypothetical protein
LDSFEAKKKIKIESLSWTMPWNPNLHLGSPNPFSLFFFFGPNQLIFPTKLCHVGLASISHFLVFNPHQLIFPTKLCHVGLASICHFFGFQSSSIDFPSKIVPCVFSLDLPLFGL